MARAFICDRCGEVYKEDDTSEYKYGLMIVEPDTYRRFDICPKCHADIEKWFKGVGHISSLYEDDLK